ncbi:MAG: CcmD family protein [Bacteroidia bacterium]|nr:CcmD family protein [Bacteroidia bacterium]HQV01523.1 CcmD family protein [Bacteroidia bacterium]
MKLLKLIPAILIFLSQTAIAQTPEMATTMRANGKIYVVVGVLAIIFLGIAIYLFGLDKKLTALEKKIKA